MVGPLLTLSPLFGPNDTIVLQRHGFSEEIAMSGLVSFQKCKLNYTAICYVFHRCNYYIFAPPDRGNPYSMLNTRINTVR